jgi:hypothetical protein
MAAEDSTGLSVPQEEDFALDLSKAPYGVPCPECRAFAIAPCRTVRRSIVRLPPGVKPPGRVLKEPHVARWEHYEAHPEFRVTVIKD